MFNGTSESVSDGVGILIFQLSVLQSRVQELEAENANLSSQLSKCGCPKGMASQRKNTGGDETRNKNSTERSPGYNLKILTHQFLREFGVEDFRGKIEDDVSIAEYWIENIQRVFQHLRYTPKQKLECAVFLLKEEANQWWMFTKQIVPAEQLTWDFFLTKFHEKYIKQQYLEEKMREFVFLKQNDMSVAEYEREFVRLSRYAKELVKTELEMCKRFERGLNVDIRMWLVGFELQDFSTLVERALIAGQIGDKRYQ